MADIHVYADEAALARAAAAHFVLRTRKAVAEYGRCAVALAGGSTPRPVYELLAKKEFAAHVNWARVHVFWGDERCVPPDHPDSNYGMACDLWLDHVPIPGSNIYYIPCSRGPEQAALAYERALRTFFARGFGGSHNRFDLIFLGMGEDGHTASLFPGTAAIQEREHWVVGHYVEKLDAWRVTLTPEIINAAANVVFLVTGAAKADRLQEVLEGPRRPDVLPAQAIQLVDGRLMWLVDEAAAAHLKGRGKG